MRAPQDWSHSYSRIPVHAGCSFDEICPKLHCDIDPVQKVMINYRRNSFRRW
jgi:hypothetical protein